MTCQGKPLTMRPSGPVFGLRRFEREYSWRIRYDFADAAQKVLPGKFHLEMELGRQLGDAPWHISVAMNGQLVAQDTTIGGVYRKSVGLPPKLHARQNVLDINVVSTHDVSGECNQPPEIFAEIRVRSHFEPGTETLGDPVSLVVEALSDGWELKARDLSLPQATLAAALLAQLPVAAGTGVAVHALPRGAKLDTWSNSDGAVWVLSLGDNDRLFAIEINEYPFSYAKDTSLLVDLRGQDS